MQNIIKQFFGNAKKVKVETDSPLNSMVLASVFLAIMYIAVDTILHIFYSDRFNLLAELFGQDFYDIYIRIIVLCLFIILGSHAQYTINNLREKEGKLKEYQDHLEDLVRDRTSELVDSNQKLKEEIFVREKSESALRESEAKYRSLVDNANDAIFIIQDHKVAFPNPKTRQLSEELGIDIDKVPFFEYIRTEDKERVLNWYKNRLEGGDAPATCSFKLVNDDQSESWVELNAALIHWEKKIASLNFLRDITSQKNLEIQFQQAQRMESIGTLAGGIAHDFNNLLMGIQGNASVLLLDIEPKDSLYENIKSIERCVQSGANLTKQLLGFARGGKYVVKPTFLNEVVNRTSSIFGRTRKEVNINTRLAEDIWTVNVDVGQVEQVLLNLYVNAWHAMPKGGDLIIETDNAFLDEDYISSKPFKIYPGDYVKISVTDNGIGMDTETQKRIFEPFFTTKELGQGTGLGLASAYGIVKNHGGFINCYSEAGIGTTINIYLPAYMDATSQDLEVVEEIIEGSETILLVDDEEEVIKAGKQMTESLGYNVLSAKNGEEALKVYYHSHDRIDMVILDMIISDISGRDVYDRMKEINPEVKVLLASGYSLNGQAEEILSQGCNGFIQKPFDMASLSQKIRQILDTSDS